LLYTMLSTRAVGLGPSFRRAVASSKISQNHAALRLAFPKRTVKTQSFPSSAVNDILNKQRVLRPSSPHFTVYQPQLTWILSIANRITGAGLSVLLYGFSLAYLFAPGTFDTAHVVDVVSGLPEGVKYAGKAILAAPFAFHSLNGLRHLSWDMGKLMTVQGCYRSGYAVLAATAVSTVVLLMK